MGIKKINKILKNVIEARRNGKRKKGTHKWKKYIGRREKRKRRES